MTEETAGTPITEDFVEHSHPQYGMGYFCTEDVLAKVAALTTQRDEEKAAYRAEVTVHKMTKRSLEAAESQRDELQKRIGYTAVPSGSQCESPPLAMSQFASKEAYWEARCLAAEDDAMTMALRLLGESDDTFAPETFEVMSRWRPKAMALVAGE